MTLIKLPWEYKEYKSAKTKEENDSINLVDKLLVQTREDGVVASNNDNVDIDYTEGLPFYHKGFFVQIFQIGDGYKGFAKTETPLHNVRFEGDVKQTERMAAQEILRHIDRFRGIKNNDNRVGR